MGLMRTVGRAARRIRSTLAGVLPASVGAAERCWPRPRREGEETVYVCAVELCALFQKNPNDAQAEELASLASGIASRFGRVTSSKWVAERAGVLRVRRGGGTLRSRLVLQPKFGRLDRGALDRALRSAMAERHKRFKVLLEDPSQLVPHGPSAGGLGLGSPGGV